ncbi:hypothetical protein BESB_081760 [Besnoitia besnoiti]|uniref:RNA polymerase I specific transcription initiation factor RRN3 n=1 Tax=Besnoitia besnoiti TaxID=94643 RepID=A0A2A9MBI3_BESBE|nr:hypothetical protein BESB_081760 [Besnoitia besnoiti]PFH32977.1 hypothetical protein BESB_081760 [Besnoitia besnoiti]
MALQAGNLPTGSRHKSSRAVYEPRVLRSASSTSASPSSSQRSYARKPEPLQSLLSSADQVFHLPAADGLSLGAAPAETRAADSQRSSTPGASSASAGPASSAASSFSDCLSELSLSSSHAAFSSPHATMTREGRGPALLALGGHSARLSRRSSDNETVPDSSFFMFPSPFSAAGEASAAGKHLPKSLPSFPPLPSSSPSDSPSTCAFSSSPSAGRSWAGGDREAKGEGERETGAGASLSPSSSPSLPSTRTHSPDKQGPAASCASRVLSIVPAPRLFSSSACSASSPPLSPPTASPAAPSLRASPVAAPLPAAAPSFSPLFGVAPAPSSSSLSSSFSSSSFASASAPAVCLPRSRTCSSLPSSLSQAHPLWRPPRAVDSPVASTSAPISPAVSRRVSPQSPAFAAFPPASPGLVAAEKSSDYYPLSPGNAASDVLSPPPDLLLSPVCSPLPPLLPKESEKSLLPPASSAAPAAAAAAAAPGTWRGREGDCKPLTGDVPQIFVHGRKLEKAPPASHAPSFFFPPPPSPFGGNASVLRLGAWLAERPGLEDDKFTPLLESFLLHFDFLAAAKTSKKLQDQQAQRYLLLDKEEEETDVSFFRPLAKPGGDAEKGPDAAAKDQLEEFETTLLDILGLRGGNGVHASVDILVGQLREKPHRHKPTGEDGGGENGGSAAGGIKIGEKFFFPDKVALKSRLRQILQAYDEKEELRGDDFELVKGVLEFHPKAKRKMQNMSGLFVSTHPTPKFRQTRCFFIRRLIHPPASASAAPAPALPSEGAPAGQVNPGTAEAATTEPREGPPSEKREETEEVGNGDRDKSEGEDAQEATKAEEKAEDARTKDAKAEEKKQEAKMEEEKGEGAKAEGQEGEPKEAKTDEGEGQKESEVKEGKGNQTELEKPDEPTEQVQEECEDFSYVRCVDNMLEDDSRADRLICHTLKQLAEAFPGCVAHLHEALRRSFPPLRFSVDVLVAYAKNLLWISQHVPQIRALLWKLLVSKMTSIDVEIKLADPNSIDLEQMQVWKREQLALLARQLEKGAVAPSVVQSILGEPQWFSLMYEKVRSEEDIDIMAAKLDGLMRVSFTFLQCFIPQLSGKPAAPGAYREDEDDDEDDESRRSPSSAPCTGDYSPCVDDEPKDEPKEGQRGSGGGLPAAEAARLRVENENALSPLPPDVFTPLLSAAPSPLIRASLHPIRTGGPSDAPVGLSPALLPARAPETGRGARAGLRGRGRGAQNEETRLRGRTEGGSKAKKPLTEADVFVYELMDVFVEVVLPVHKCKYVQFLIFYLANLRVEWAGRLMSLLFRMVFDRQQHVLLRRISAVYISSFLCRALLVPSRFVRLALHHFFQLLHRGFLMTGSRSAPRQQQRLLDLLRAQHQTVYNPESPLALFYTICQSCCYILCYHLDALANSSPSLSFLKERNTSLEALLVSPLRPLMHIKRGIAREFVAACRRVGMLDSSPEFENALKQVQLRDPPISSASCALGAGDKGEAIEEEKAARGDDVSRYGEATSNDLLSDVLWLFDPLDAFFPFDRYLLRHSERFISNKYRDWSAVVAFVMQREEEKKKLGAAGDGKRKSEQAEEEENEDREAPRALAQEVTQRGEGLREEGEGGRDCRKPDDGARRVDAAAEGKKGDGKREEGLDDDDDDILDTTGALSLTLEDESGSEAEKAEAREHEQAKDQHEEEGSGRASRERRLSVGSAGEERKNDAALPRGETEASHAPIVTQQPQHNLKPREHLTNSEMDALQQLVQDSLGFASASRELEASVRQRLGGLAGATAKKDERRAANLQDKRSLRPEEEAEGGDADGRRPSACSGAGEPLRELAGLERQLREMSGLGLDEGSSEAAAEEPEEGEEEEGDDERSVGSESEEGDWGGGDTGEWASLSSLFSEDGHELEDDEATEGDEEEGAVEADARGGGGGGAAGLLAPSAPLFAADHFAPKRRAKQDGPSSTGCRGGKAKHELSFLAPGVAASIANQLELEIDALGDDALSQSNLRFLRNKSGLSRASMLDIFLSSHAYRPAPASPAPTPAASPFLGPSCAAIPVRDFPREAKRRRGGGKGLEAPSSPPTLSVSGAPTEPPPADFVLAPSQVFLSPPGATPATRGDAEKAEGAAWEQRPSRGAQPGTLDDARESPQPPAVAPHAGGIAGHRRVRNISPMLLPSAPRSLEVLKEVEGEDEDDLEGDNERQQRQDSPGSERRAGAEREEEPEKGGELRARERRKAAAEVSRRTRRSEADDEPLASWMGRRTWGGACSRRVLKEWASRTRLLRPRRFV